MYTNKKFASFFSVSDKDPIVYSFVGHQATEKSAARRSHSGTYVDDSNVSEQTMKTS